ncbi:BGL2 [[Candida] subhashii]|uniref:beta-glucosidase n=1 Tax=[Candida] subhashii TaxID=561895 RepID=A0A8J5UJ70_9ASCO|nr:BGL2 [[Candida] subhashii]KAG7660886.1 BGL2 [[Candida] subhashii]
MTKQPIPIDFDIDSIIDQLTLSEKISLLAGYDFWHTTPIPRLGIKSVKVTDGPQGVRGSKFFNSVPANCFPCGTGLASTFNQSLLVEVGQLLGYESKLKGAHVVLGPTCNIVRGPVGGRGFESYSEDPVLSGIAAGSVISGIQKEDVVACIKHFVCNDQETERKAVNVVISERALREIYLKPFQIAIRDSCPGAVMAAYNKINGVHVSQNKKLLNDVLREEWGWDGMVMSDWHGVYSTKESLDAGLNLEMPGPTRFRQELPLTHSIQTNEIHRDVIDDNVRQVLKLVQKSYKANIPDDAIEVPNPSKEAEALLRKVANESIVLLKNQDNILPLPKDVTPDIKTIAVIGPNAKVAQDSGGGSASLNARYKITPFDGIKEKLKDSSIELTYALGAYLDRNLPDVGHVLINNEGKPGITGKFYKQPPGTSGDRELFEEYQLSTSRLFLSDFKSDKLDRNQLLFYADFLGTYIPDESGEYYFGCSCLGTAQIFVDDKLIVDNKTKQVKGDAFFLGLGTREERNSMYLKKGVKYQVRVEFGSSPSYTLNKAALEGGGVFFGIQKKIAPEIAIQEAVDVAKAADAVVLVVGLSKEWESEGFDRPNMDIPGYTNQLIQEVSKVNSNIVVVNQSGTPVTVLPWIDNVKGFVQAWYGGNELGNSIADVLFGDHNPSGKLSISFPKRFEDNPSYLNFGSSDGQVIYGEDVFVGYRYYEKVKRDVLFPFGFGLSYTKFAIGDLELVVDENEGTLLVTVSVSNKGELAGAEVIQLYVQEHNPQVIRPVKELKAFEKVYLVPGETKRVSMSVSIKEATSYWNNYKNKWQSTKGKYSALVGNSSDNIIIQQEFETTKTKFWLGV